MKFFKSIQVLFIALLLSLFLVGCEEKGAAEKAGEKIDKTLEKAKDTVEDASEKLTETLEKAKEE